MTSNELNLDQDWSIGEEAFAVLLQELRANAVRTIVEFGAGRSSVRLALEFPEAEIHTIDHNKTFFENTVRLLKHHIPDGKVQAHLRPLVWQRHAGALYLSYREGPFPTGIDVVIIDGPPIWTRRGREACLYQVLDKLRVGGRVYLDDFSRPGEQRIVGNWTATIGQAFTFRRLEVGHHWCVLQKQKPAERPGVSLSVTIDSWEQNLRWAYDAVQDGMTRISQHFERNPSKQRE